MPFILCNEGSNSITQIRVHISVAHANFSFFKLTTSEFSLSFLWLLLMVVKVLTWPLTVVNDPPVVVVLLTKWSLIVNKGSWLETGAVVTDNGVEGGVCWLWNVVAWKKALVEEGGGLPEMAVNAGDMSLWRATAAATAAETAVLKFALEGDTGSCRRSWKMEESKWPAWKKIFVFRRCFIHKCVWRTHNTRSSRSRAPQKLTQVNYHQNQSRIVVP